ncbi:MAG: DegQ family serine endoprotease [Rickettsiales bacterium]|nr:DegQ family serine endoprotease [Rickettsiales bacterium]
MKPIRQWVFACAAACFLVASPVCAAAPDSFAPIIEPLMPAVVNISTTQKVHPQVQAMVPMFDFDGLPDTPQNRQLKQLFRQFNPPQGGGALPGKETTSLGSGFVIDASGYVVTNNHVVGDAEEIRVIFPDNTHYPATLVGRDPKTDLAVLKIKGDKPFPAVTFGDSDSMHVGDWVIAVGNPFGLGGSVSAGIVSARGRNINAGPFDDFIQTDAAINRGNSGGPLFNARGEVVGINSAIFSPTGGNIGIGFAIPSALAKNVVEQLKKDGVIHRGWLGVKIQLVSEEIANSLGLNKPRGALVLEVGKDSPAVGSGLTAGDVILKFDGREIDEMRKLPRYVAETKIGKKVDLVVWRKGREVTISTKVEELPRDDASGDDAGEKRGSKQGAAPKPSAKDMVLGMQLVPITPQLRAQFQLKSTVRGLIVDDIDGSGEGAKRGLRPGDIIVEANQSTVDSVDALRAALRDAKKAGHDFALLRVVRGADVTFVTVSVK